MKLFWVNSKLSGSLSGKLYIIASWHSLPSTLLWTLSIGYTLEKRIMKYGVSNNDLPNWIKYIVERQNFQLLYFSISVIIYLFICSEKHRNMEKKMLYFDKILEHSTILTLFKSFTLNSHWWYPCDYQNSISRSNLALYKIRKEKKEKIEKLQRDNMHYVFVSFPMLQHVKCLIFFGTNIIHMDRCDATNSSFRISASSFLFFNLQY